MENVLKYIKNTSKKKFENENERRKTLLWFVIV